MSQVVTSQVVNTAPPADPAAVAAQAAQQVMQIGSGYILSAALWAAARLDVAELLANGPRPIAEIARTGGANEDALYRTLRALAMVGIFAETAPRTFANTPASDLLRRDVPGSVRAMALWLPDPFHFRVYAETLHAVKTGETVGERVVNMPIFEYFGKDTELSERFNDAMTNFSANVAPAVLEAYDFGGIGTLVDIAGGHGMILSSILQRYPTMRGILFDIEHVLQGAGPLLDRMEVRGRVELASGDFFKAVPSGGDAYLMKHIIHDWDDEKATVILKNIRTALGGKTNGRVMLIEGVIQPGAEPDLMKVIDLEMLLLPGGRERTADQFVQLFAGAGFELTRIVPTKSPLAVIEARVR
jgi:hypothetical protein